MTMAALAPVVLENAVRPDLEKLLPGLWAANVRACSSRPSHLLPTMIDEEGARAGETFCAFRKKTRQGNTLNVVASCSNPRERWTSRVKLVLDGDRLRWISQRGSQAYVRCGPRVMMAAGAL
jgi:hypothetical protein